MSDDYKKGYRDGFKDGFEAAKKHNPVIPTQITDIVSTCPKCNISFKGPMGYVCVRSDCPNFQVTCL
jgi:hypothetical protein